MAPARGPNLAAQSGVYEHHRERVAVRVMWTSPTYSMTNCPAFMSSLQNRPCPFCPTGLTSNFAYCRRAKHWFPHRAFMRQSALHSTLSCLLMHLSSTHAMEPASTGSTQLHMLASSSSTPLEFDRE